MRARCIVRADANGSLLFDTTSIPSESRTALSKSGIVISVWFVQYLGRKFHFELHNHFFLESSFESKYHRSPKSCKCKQAFWISKPLHIESTDWKDFLSICESPYSEWREALPETPHKLRNDFQRLLLGIWRLLDLSLSLSQQCVRYPSYKPPLNHVHLAGLALGSWHRLTADTPLFWQIGMRGEWCDLMLCLFRCLSACVWRDGRF